MKLNFHLVSVTVLVVVALTFASLPVAATSIYRVKQGDSLGEIAKYFRTNLNWMAEQNNILNVNNIYPGQVLLTPVPFGTKLYKVAPGESLYEIGQKHGSDFGIIANFNRISDPDILIPQQPLLIPPFTAAKWGAPYTVQPGDTLFEIALRYGVDATRLSWYNGLAYPDLIYQGQELRIPDPLPKESTGSQNPSSPTPKSTYVYNIPLLMGTHPDRVFLKGSSEKRQVALTFDDGPDARFTPAVLDVLAQEGVQATFFLMGQRVSEHPEIVNRILQEGHVIGNHSWSHPNLRNQEASLAMDTQVRKTSQVIKEISGVSPALVRPPYGEMSEGLLKMMAQEGYTMVNWSADSNDWSDRNIDKILVNTLSGTRPGSIILMHSAGGVGQDLTPTIKALPELIYTLRMEGFEFVTLDKMLGLPAYN